MRLSLLLSTLLLVGCHQGKPKWSDQDIRRIQAEMPGMTAACLDKLRWGGTEALPKNNDDCFQFTQPMRMQGLWRNDFEGSEYCDGPVSKCPDATVEADPRSFTWLKLEPLLAGWEDTQPGGLYAIDFIGRRSLGEGSFGHFGMSKHEVIVDHLLSIREVEAPPPQPTKAEMIKYFKECEEAKTCIPNWNDINQMDEAQMKKAHIEGYLKDCADKQICMPNSEVPQRR